MGDAPSDVLLRAVDVARTYEGRRLGLGKGRERIEALRGVSVEVGHGQIHAVVGESGCGKSTFSRIVAGLDAPTRGEIQLDGRPLDLHIGGTDRLTLLRRVQMVFQDPASSLDPRLTVQQILVEPQRGLHIEGDHVARTRELLEAVHLPAESIARRPHEFSGGQRQRIAIARALAADPKLLIADEPVSALDVSVRAAVLQLFDELRNRFGLGILLVSHDLSVVRHVSEIVSVMYAGRIVESGPTGQVFGDPQHPYTQALLLAAPRLGVRLDVDRLEVEPSIAAAATGCPYRTRCPLVHEACQHEPELLDVGSGVAVSCHALEKQGATS